MRLPTALCALTLLVGCGPAQPYTPPPRVLTAKITNEYAESLFTLTVHVKAGSNAPVARELFRETRIEAFESARADFNAETGDVVSFDLIAMSLGENRTFMTQQLEPVLATRSTLAIVYDYDLARANFNIGFGWQP